MRRALVGMLVLVLAVFLLVRAHPGRPPSGAGGAGPAASPSPAGHTGGGTRSKGGGTPGSANGPGSPGSAWGVDAYSAPPTLINQVQDLMGGGFEAFSDYHEWNGYRAWPGRTARLAKANNGLLYLNINTHERPGSAKVPVCWSSIAAGEQDDVVVAWAAAIVREGAQRNTIITIEHEPNVTSRHQPKCHGDTPAAYRAMFDHVYRVMRAHGVTARFAFVPTMSVYRTHQADAYLPPAADVQVYGADEYNRVPRGRAGYHAAASDLATMLAWGDQHLPGRGVILGEIGDTRADPAQGAWVEGILAAARTHGHFLALNWNLTPGYLPLNGPALDVWLGWARRLTR